MLALATGWTPDVLADLPARFRAACHWALYARAVAGPDGLRTVRVPDNAPLQTRLDALALNDAIAQIRAVLFPEDD